MATSAMDAGLIDPRDEVVCTTSPAYRVDFWEGDAACSTYRLSNVVDVDEARSWAETNREGRTFVLYAEHWLPDGKGLVQLLGIDPTIPTGPAEHVVAHAEGPAS